MTAGPLRLRIKTTSPRSPIALAAQRLLAAGLSVIPIQPDGSKRPTVSWKRYQKACVDAATLATWFHDGEGLAVVAGAVSGGLEVLDFDAPELFPPWCALVEELCPALLAHLPMVQTPSDGRHVYYRCPSIQGNLKLAQRLNPDGRPEILIETRGEGGYAIIPPSPPRCHPLQRSYVLLCGDLAAIPTITAEERRLLLNAARTFNAYVPPARVISGHATPLQPSSREGTEIRPGDAYNTAGEWAALLEGHGWTPVCQRGEVTYWRRPGKADPGISATTNYAGSGLLYVFSTNAAPFEAEQAYTRFAAYALLYHAGDFTAAAKVLAAQGYGQPQRQDRPPAADPWLGPGTLRQGIPLAVRRISDEGSHG